MCNHETLALIQEKLQQQNNKSYYCFSCKKVVALHKEPAAPVLDLRFTPLDIVKKRFI